MIINPVEDHKIEVSGNLIGQPFPCYPIPIHKHPRREWLLKGIFSHRGMDVFIHVHNYEFDSQ